MSAGDRQAGDNVERKLDFTGGQQDENANVIMCECMRGENKCVFSFCLPAAQSPFSLPRPSFSPPASRLSFLSLSPGGFPSIPHRAPQLPPFPPTALPPTAVVCPATLVYHV